MNGATAGPAGRAWVRGGLVLGALLGLAGLGRAAEPGRSAVEGVVYLRGRADTPALGVPVAVGRRRTHTDARGRFLLGDLPAGATVLRVGDPAREVALVLAPGATARVEVRLDPPPADVLRVVGHRGAAAGPRRRLTLTELRGAPGSSGDPLRAVQDLPGVARAPFGLGLLVLRGSNPTDSLALVEGHRVPLAFHFGGVRTVLPAELLASVDLYPGNFGVDHGGATGGLVDLTLRRPADDGLHGHAEADIFDAGVFLEGPLHRGAAFAVGARRSYVDAVLPAFVDEDALQLTVAPRYLDYQALYDLRRGAHRVRALFFGSDDAVTLLARGSLASDPRLEGDLDDRTRFLRGWAEWKVALAEGLDHAVSVAVGRDRLRLRGGGVIDVEVDATLVSLRQSLRWAADDHLAVTVGADGELWSGRLAVDGLLPPKEGEGADAVPLTTRPMVETRQDATLTDLGVYAQVDWRPAGGPLQLVPGVRTVYAPDLDAHTVDPRLNARLALGADTALTAGAGRYSQRPAPDETLPVLGNPALAPERALHLSLGVERRLTAALGLELTGFHKRLDDLVVPADDPAVRYSNHGEGRVRGLEVLLRHAPGGRFFGWIAYTLSSSVRRDAPGARTRLFDHDQTHVLAAVGRYQLTSGWAAGARLRYATGNPRTPLRGGLYDSDADTYVPYALPTNSARLGDFLQLDLRVERRFVFDAWTLTAWLEVQNATARANPELVVYDHTYRRSDTVDGLPLLPTFGLRGAF